jgi:hypothetical protein
MNRRQEMIDTIQGLSEEEGMRQPSAADWLADQEQKASWRRERDKDQQAGRDYQSDPET